jgi:hypothetical protein
MDEANGPCSAAPTRLSNEWRNVRFWHKADIEEPPANVRYLGGKADIIENGRCWSPPMYDCALKKPLRTQSGWESWRSKTNGASIDSAIAPKPGSVIT